MGRVECSEKFPIEGNFSAGRVGDPPLRGGREEAAVGGVLSQHREGR